MDETRNSKKQSISTFDLGEISPEMMQESVVEFRENLATAEAALVQLDQNKSDREALNDVFRAIHTLKGASSYLGLHQMKDLSHVFESILEKLRQKEVFTFSESLLDLCFQVIDCLKGLVELKNLREPDEVLIRQVSELKVSLENFQDHSESTEVNAQPQLETFDKLGIFKNSVKQQMKAINHCIHELKQEDKNNRENAFQILLRTYRVLESSSQFVNYDLLETHCREMIQYLSSPLDSSLDPSLIDIQKLNDSLDLIQKTIENPDSIQTKEEQDFYNELGKITQTFLQASESKKVPLAKDSSNEEALELKTMRINQDYLDQFMNLVGELVIAKNALTHLQNQFEGSEEQRKLAIRELKEAANKVSGISGEMQQTVRKIRLIPIQTVFQKFPRMVRDLSRQTGKKVSLQFEGGETEIDKKIADEINDPLLHLLRNAIDHGLESSEDRRKSGKSEQGIVLLKAFHENNTIVIEIVDDGAGIDIDRVSQKAIEKGLMTVEEVQSKSKAELIELIFEPGFSTASQVTEISGRGVGMDVVRTKIRQIHGKISVQTEKNQGTTFRLELPLTMAVMESLLVSSQKQLYAFPLHSVSEIIKVSYSELKSMMGGKAVCVRGEMVGVVILSEMMGTRHASVSNLQQLRYPILIIHSAGEKLGVLVDSVDRKEEIVVKPLSNQCRSVPLVSGASILGDGRAILILDPSKIMESLVKITSKKLNSPYQIQEA